MTSTSTDNDTILNATNTIMDIYPEFDIQKAMAIAQEFESAGFIDTCENLSKIIICQSIIRKWLVSKKNIHSICKKLNLLQDTFKSVINGYHIINKTPIKETVWEEVNCDIVRDVCNISDEANGNHVSGKDNRFDNCNVSNKSAKTDKDKVSISSYRLSSVCDSANNGNPSDIINEIERRDESFDMYSLLVRSEKENPIIGYSWYMIPKDHFVFKINELVPKIGKMGKKKGKIVGWKSEYCDITFSMSSQLWYKFNIETIEKYKISYVEVDNSKSKINYSQIYNSFSNTI